MYTPEPARQIVRLHSPLEHCSHLTAPQAAALVLRPVLHSESVPDFVGLAPPAGAVLLPAAVSVPPVGAFVLHNSPPTIGQSGRPLRFLCAGFPALLRKAHCLPQGCPAPVRQFHLERSALHFEELPVRYAFDPMYFSLPIGRHGPARPSLFPLKSPASPLLIRRLTPYRAL